MPEIPVGPEAGLFGKLVKLRLRLPRQAELGAVKGVAEAAVEDGGKRPLLKRLFGGARNDVPRTARVVTRDPIDVASGEVVLHRRDVELRGVLPLVLERTHISSYEHGRLFGPSWASTLDQHLEVDAEGVRYAAADGMVLSYPLPGIGVQVFPLSGPRWPLTYESDGTYTVRDPRAGLTMRFGSRERKRPLETIADRNGNRIDLTYGEPGSLREILHSGGYRIGVETQDGRIVALRLLSGGREQVLVRYGYDDAGDLAQVFDSSGEAQNFGYDDHHRLTAWRDRNRYWYRYTYDEQGRGIRGTGTQGTLDTELRYDPGGRWTVVTDSLGNTTTYHLDDRRRVTSQVDPLGHTTAFEWDEHDRMLSRTDALGNTSRYGYDNSGNLITLRRPDGYESRAEYDAHGLPRWVMEADGTVWRNEHDDQGNLTAVVDPLGNATRYGHDERGAITSIVDPLGNETTVEANAAGLPLRIVDSTGSAITYTYDALGRAATVTDPVGGTAHFTWTPEGRPTSRKLPGGTVELWAYDAEGNLVTHSDGSGRTARTQYGPFATPTAHTSADGTRLTFEHDTELRLTAVINQQGLTWKYDYDAAGNLVGETDFDHRVLRYGHDEAGRVTSRADGDERPTVYLRDLLGTVVEKRTHEQSTHYGYDLQGRLVRAVTPVADLRFDRDALGRVTAEICDGRILAFAYDAAGRRTERRTPAGAVSTWGYDPAGRPTTLVTADQRFEFTHDPAGRETKRRIGANTIVTQMWDADHRLVSQEIWRGPRANTPPALVQHRTYVHGPGGEITAAWDQLTGSRRFDTDRAGRVTAVHAQGWTERYAYNEAGDPVEATWPAASTDEAQALGEREYRGSRLHRAGRTFYTYDDRGRTVLRRLRTLSGQERSWRYDWDAEDRLVAVTTPEGHEWRYRYDALGRRVAKLRLGADGTVVERTDFTWDGERLVEEAHRVPGGAARVTSWEYRPDGYEPIAQYRRGVPADASQEWFDREFHAIVTDAVGSPAELVDLAGDVTWRRNSTLFGGRLDSPVSCPIGFPGQYHDAETGLEYNRHRYYDACAARYLSNDPIGLAGGIRTYGYVRNPLVQRDPLGLTQEVPPGMVRIFRVTSRPEETRIFQETGLLMSDAAQQGYREGGTVESALRRSQGVHDINVRALGGEDNYAWAHQGGAVGALPVGTRSMISFSTDEAGAVRWARTFGQPLYSAVVHPSELNWATNVGTESEVLARHAIAVEPWK